MSWLQRRSGGHWGRTIFTCGVLERCLFVLFLVFVPDHGLEVPQLAPTPTDSPPDPVPRDFQFPPMEPSTSGAPDVIPEANFTTSSSDESLDLTTFSSVEPLNIITPSSCEPENLTTYSSEPHTLRTSSSGDLQKPRTWRLVDNFKWIILKSGEVQSSVNLPSGELMTYTYSHAELKSEYYERLQLGRYCESDYVIKCCPFGQVLEDKGECVDYKANSGETGEDPFKEMASKQNVLLRPMGYQCTNKDISWRDVEFPLHWYLNNWRVHRDHKCFDYHRSKNKMTLKRVHCNQRPTEWSSVRHLVITAGYAISIVSLFVTLFFHISVPQLRQSQGLYFIVYIIMLLMTEILLFTMELIPYFLAHRDRSCIAIGYMLYYFIVASLCWLSVICADVLQRIRLCCYMIRCQVSTNKKTLAIYCAFGFGFPLVLLIIAVTMDFIFKNNMCLIRPNIGQFSCFFDQRYTQSRMLYLILPVSVLFAVDLVLLTVAFYMMSQFNKANQRQATTTLSFHPKEKRTSFFTDCLCSFLGSCQSKFRTDNSSKLETEDSKGRLETKCKTKDSATEEDFSDQKEKNDSGEIPLNNRKSLSMDTIEIHSVVTTSTSIDSLSSLDHSFGNAAALASSNDFPLVTENFNKPSSETSSESQDKDHMETGQHKLSLKPQRSELDKYMQEQPTRRQTRNGMRKFAQKDFRVEFWHKVIIFASVMFLCTTASLTNKTKDRFTVPEDKWAFVEVLNSLQGFIHLVLFLRNSFKRRVCEDKYPAIFSKINAMESALARPFSYLMGFLCQKH